MKTTLRALILAIVFPLLSSGDELPPIPGAQVTIPYQELKNLLDASRQGALPQPDPEPPLDADLAIARYLLDFSGPLPRLQAEFDVRTFTDGWHAVPLFGGDSRLEKSEVTAGDASVIWQDQSYSLLAKGAGDFSVRVSLTLPDIVAWKKNGFRLSPSPASVGEIRVSGLPENQTIRIKGLSPRSENGEMLFSLPGEKAEWLLALETSAMADAIPAVQSIWSLHSEILVRYLDGRLQHSARLQGHAEAGSGQSITLALPLNAQGITVEGEGISEWKPETSSSESRLLRIDWETPGILDRTFLLHWEIPQSPLANVWSLAPPRVQQPESPPENTPLPESRSLMALVAVDGLEITHPSLQAGIERQRLTDWLRKQLGQETGLTAEIIGDEPIRLDAAWLPRLETAQATVSLAKFKTRLVRDGSMLVTAEYTIQHAEPLIWSLNLPSADQILSCLVNANPDNPIRRGDDKIEFHFTAPNSADMEAPSTTVEMSYSVKTDPLDAVSGQVALDLPQTSLFIHRLEWTLAIPDGYEPTAVEGNVQISTTPSDSELPASHIQFEKELCRGERPGVEIYYQRSEVSAKS